ncbi:hypothetical protein NKI31_26865 [Mesorhizobium sp. M0659]|uniref:hypothetical protein n=1 Tax=Mesorhizobium sp. M0659 TaxID=2956980 RepID=UPI003339850B
MKELKGRISKFCRFFPSSVAFDQHFFRSAKLSRSQGGKACPAVLNQSPIRDPDAASLSASVT